MRVKFPSLLPGVLFLVDFAADQGEDGASAPDRDARRVRDFRSGAAKAYCHGRVALPGGTRTARTKENTMSSLPKKTKATVIPCLRYRDAPAAIEWLCRAFGFE